MAFDLDDEELRKTRETRGLTKSKELEVVYEDIETKNEIVANVLNDEDITDWILEREDGMIHNEIRADYEFDKLGYTKNEYSVMIIYSLPNTDKKIVFYKDGALGVNNEYKGFEYFTLKELDIIQMKVEELKNENWFE